MYDLNIVILNFKKSLSVKMSMITAELYSMVGGTNIKLDTDETLKGAIKSVLKVSK